MSLPIIQLTVEPHQRQNDSTWYPIQIKLHNYCYEQKYRFSEFVQFSRTIQQQFDIDYLVPLHSTIKSRFRSIIKKTERDRQLQLEKFCAQLVLLPSHVICSYVFLSFFSASKQQMNTVKRMFPCKSKKQDLVRISNRLSRQSITTTFSRSSNDSSSTIGTSSSSTITGSSLSAQDIKIKVIYDYHNIIIIRVTRAISLDQLKSRIIQKFALLRIPLPDQLAFFDLTETAPFHGSDGMISDEYQLRTIMHQKWVSLEKVTLQCII
jgi:hypothetical protein